MNISAYILEYLKSHGSAVVPQFGTFSLEKSKAVINSENGSILPPASRIIFTANDQAESAELAKFLAEKKSVSKEAAENEILVQTDFWKKKLQAEKQLEIPEIGCFYSEANEIRFEGERLPSDHPDFYGLEEIRFSDINPKEKKETPVAERSDYRFNKSILWIFLIIVPVLAMLYLAYTQQDLLLGKKSFDSVSVQTKTRRIENKKTVKVDSAAIKKQDSILNFKKDSLRKDSVKKANPKSFKKSQKRRWRK